MDNSFSLLRGYARGHNLRLVDVAHSVVDRTLDLDSVARRPKRPR